MNKSRLPWPARPLLLSALILSIPAFYLVLTGTPSIFSSAGHWLYGIVAAMLGLEILLLHNKGKARWLAEVSKVDFFILLGALASTLPTALPWSVVEWILRMTYCAVVFARLATLVAKYVAPNRLLQIAMLAVFVMAIAGAGFLWLEPKVHNYADGVWLAFITGATVGYGDLVPSTPASRIFAGFIVLLGYALFSIVTASIAALLVGEDERRFMRLLHLDIRMLREEIAVLRADLHDSIYVSGGNDGEHKDMN